MKILNVRDVDHGKIKAMSELTGLSMVEIVSRAVEEMTVPTVGKDAMTPKEHAMSKGENKYQGNPCVHGHDGVRYTRTGMCVTCAMNYQKFRKVVGESREMRLSREIAHGRGFSQYDSDVVCSSCHGVRRWVKSGQCCLCFSGDGVRIR